EIRVDDDAGGVQRPPEPRRLGRAELGREPLRQVTRIRAGPNLHARARENTPRRVDGERVVAHPGELVDRGEVAQAHDQILRTYCASALRGSAGISAQRSA